MSKNKKKMKSTIDIMKQVRNKWYINPRTKVQEDETKNKKKRRQEEKKIIKDYNEEKL